MQIYWQSQQEPGTVFYNNYVSWWQNLQESYIQGSWHYYVSDAFKRQFPEVTVLNNLLPSPVGISYIKEAGNGYYIRYSTGTSPIRLGKVGDPDFRVFFSLNIIEQFVPASIIYQFAGQEARVAAGQGGNEINFNDKAWFVVPTSANDLVNFAAEQSWKTSVKSVRLGSVEAQVQRGLSKAVRFTKYTGWAGNSVNLTVNYANAYSNWNGPNSGFYNAKAVGATIIVGLNGLNFLVPGLGTVLSITAEVIDASGGFDWIYDEFN